MNWKGEVIFELTSLVVGGDIIFNTIPMDILFAGLLVLIAFLYSSIGHGGASGYLALMALFAIETIYMKTSALTLNLFVSGIAFINYKRGRYFKWRILWPFIVTSMPFSYFGASLKIDPQLYKIILGLFLVMAVMRLLLFNRNGVTDPRPVKILPALVIGALLGFLSGMIGIGGGIILSPILLLLQWADIKQAAAVSALFIFLNSAMGLLGNLNLAINYPVEIYIWIAMGLTGAVIGSYFGSFKSSPVLLKYILSVVLILASIKLFIL